MLMGLLYVMPHSFYLLFSNQSCRAKRAENIHFLKVMSAVKSRLQTTEPLSGKTIILQQEMGVPGNHVV